MSATSALRPLHFGKLPSRGDFVRSPQPAALIQALDDWLSSGMEALAVDARWKLLYDRAAPVHFAFLGSRSTRGLVGHLMASHDASGRRFPFLVAAPLEVPEPGAFVARSPLVLARAWQVFEAWARQAYTAPDVGAKLAEWGQAEVALDLSTGSADSRFQAFVEAQTLGGVQHLLQQAGHPVSLRTLLLGLGLLLEKVPSSGLHRLDKGLLLPLPQDPLLRPLVASLWLDLVGSFLQRAAFELVLLLPQAAADAGPPVLALGFDGPTPQTLQGLIDPDCRDQVFLDASQADWVEAFVGSDYAVQKLSSYLQHPDLSLRQAVATFKETFLGC